MEEENKKAEENEVLEQVTKEKLEKTAKEEKPKKKSKKTPKKETKQEPKNETKKVENKNESAKQIIQEVVSLIEEQKESSAKEEKIEVAKEEKVIEEPEKKIEEAVEIIKDEEEKNPQFVPVEKQPKSKRKGIMITFSIVIAFIVISIFSIIFALMNINNKKILKGISILGIEVGNLTIDEAKERINDAVSQKFSNEKDSLVLKHGELEISVNANTFNAKFDVDTAVAEAYNIGRGGNIITNNYATEILRYILVFIVNYFFPFLLDIFFI